jgi:hypothetical protein
LQAALNQAVTIRAGKRQKTLSKSAAGIEHLANQWAAGDRHARRDLLVLSEKLGLELTDRDALQGALEDALSAEDEALLADFVRRHGGHYPVGADAGRSLLSQGKKLLGSSAEDPKLLTARSENSTSPPMVQRTEQSDD